MVEKFINQNEDIDLQITVLQITGSVLPMNTAQNIYVIIYDGYGIVCAKFTATNAGSGWDVLDITNAAVGVVSARILSAVTKAMKPGKYYTEIGVRYSDVLSADDSLYDVNEDQYAFSIKPSLIHLQTPLP